MTVKTNELESWTDDLCGIPPELLECIEELPTIEKLHLVALLAIYMAEAIDNPPPKSLAATNEDDYAWATTCELDEILEAIDVFLISASPENANIGITAMTKGLANDATLLFAKGVY